jgi:hypothetical protein
MISCPDESRQAGGSPTALRGAVKQVDAGIGLGEFPNNAPGTIGRIVVYDQDMIIRTESKNILDECGDVAGFVIGGKCGEDGWQIQGCSLVDSLG